jgi:hypothetical protein
MCPHCGKNAPIVNRGLAAYCTACGRPRLPLSGKSLSLAGKPSKVGGVVAGVLGWAVLIGGVGLALLLGLVLAWLFPGTIAGLAVGLPIALMSLAVALLLLLGGRKLRQTGTEAERDTRIQAIFSLAANRGGALLARDVGAALDMSAEDADALLTELAKERSDEVTVEIGERGEIFYAFPGIMGEPRVRFPQPGARIDVAEPAAAETEAAAAEEIGAAPAPPRRERVR